MMKRKNTKRWAMHPMVRCALEVIGSFIALIAIGITIAYAVVYFMLWIS